MALVVVWLHVLSAVVWIGGMAFLALVLVPALREAPVQGRTDLFGRVGRRFRLVGWAALAVLLVTGVLNLGNWGYSWADLASGRLWEGVIGTLMAVKLILVGVVLVLGLIHDLLLGPRALALARQEPGSPRALRMRSWASWVGRAGLLLGAAIVLLALSLRRG